MPEESLKWYKADLHIHSVLSPCGELEMGVSNIVSKAKELGIDIISICDHNTGANLRAFCSRGEEEGITVIAGMEVQTREEVHCLCFFPGTDDLEGFEEEFNDTLPKINNKPEVFGDQVIIDQNENILGFEERLLLASSSLGISDLVKLVKEYKGQVVPAHIDKKYYSLISNLGFIPDYDLLGLEIFNYVDKNQLIKEYAEVERYPLMVSSDAHRLEEMKTSYKTFFYIYEPSFEEIVMAFNNLKGRRLNVFKNDIKAS